MPTLHPIQTVVLAGRRGDGPRVLITGGVHGDEFEPMAAVRALAEAIDPARLRGRLTLAPVVNEPAYLRDDRCAEDGLDLARTCPGDPAGSTTQRVAAALAALIRDAEFYADLHTGGTRLRLCPLAGYMLHADPAILSTQRRMARAFGLPLVWGTSARLDGRSLSVARDAGVPAIYAEHGGGGLFEQHAADDYVAGCLRMLAAIGAYDGPVPAPSTDGEQTVVEDDRDRSGHLQVQHPAPAEGFFEPAVHLGQKVSVGDRIGRVVDVLGRPIAESAAADDGIVVMLRTWRRVNRGDALAALACGRIERVRGEA